MMLSASAGVQMVEGPGPLLLAEFTQMTDLSLEETAISDAGLIRYAYAFEQAMAVRRPPPID